jgi:hypothetical protein
MKVRMLAVTLGLAAFAWAGLALTGLALTGLSFPGPALAGPALVGSAHPVNNDGTPEEQQDCQSDALTYCSEYIFASDRNVKIGNCLMLHRTQISKECRSHLPHSKK